MTHGFMIRDRAPNAHIAGRPPKLLHNIRPSSMLPSDTDNTMVHEAFTRILCNTWADYVPWMCHGWPRCSQTQVFQCFTTPNGILLGVSQLPAGACQYIFCREQTIAQSITGASMVLLIFTSLSIQCLDCDHNNASESSIKNFLILFSQTTKTLAGQAKGTANWCTTVWNRFCQIVMSLLTL